MIDTLEKTSVQDIAFAKALGIDMKEVEELSLHQMRIEMQRQAFKWRDEKKTISQEEADILNKRLNQIIQQLEEIGDYDASVDYIVDFNSFVAENPYYNRFSW